MNARAHLVGDSTGALPQRRLDRELLGDSLDRRQNDPYHHRNALEDAGLVGKFRDGSSRVYELSPLAEDVVPGLFDAIGSRADPRDRFGDAPLDARPLSRSRDKGIK